MPKVCCVCQRVEENGAWKVQDLSRDTIASHGYCAACAIEARKELALFRQRKADARQLAHAARQ